MQGAQFALALAVIASAAALSSLLIYLLRPVLIRYLLAHPNERSSHVRATPQGAGLGVMLALFLIAAAGWLLWGARGGGMAGLMPVLVAAGGLTVAGISTQVPAHCLVKGKMNERTALSTDRPTRSASRCACRSTGTDASSIRPTAASTAAW